MGSSGKRAEMLAEARRFAGGEEAFDVFVGALPDGNGARKDGCSTCSEGEQARAAVRGVGRDADEAAALEGLESGGQGGAVHGEQRGDGGHAGRFGAIERHHERELPVGEAGGAESFVEAAGEGAGGALDVEAEAGVANEEGSLVRDGGGL